MDTPRSIPHTPSWGSIYTTLSAPHHVVEVDTLATALLWPTASLPDIVADHKHLSLMATMLLGRKITDLLGPDQELEHKEHNSCLHHNNNNDHTKTMAPSPSSLAVSVPLPLSLASPLEPSCHVIPMRSLVGSPTHRQRRILCVMSVSPDDPPRRHYMVCDASSSPSPSSPLGHAQTGEVGYSDEGEDREAAGQLPMVRRHSLLPSLPNAARVTIATRPSTEAVNATLKTTSTPTTTPEAPAAAATTTTTASFMRDSLSSPAAQGARVHRRCLSGMNPPALFPSNSSTWPLESSNECSGLPSPSLLPSPTFTLPSNPSNPSKMNTPTAVASPAATAVCSDRQHSSNKDIPLQANGHVRGSGPESGQGSIARDNPPAMIMMQQQLPCSSRTSPPNNSSFSSCMVNNTIDGGEPLSNLPVAPPAAATGSTTTITTATTTTPATTGAIMTPRTSCSHSSSSCSCSSHAHAHAYAHRKGSMHRRYSDTWNDPTGVNMIIDHPPLMSPSPSPTPPAFHPSPTMPSTLLVLQVTRFGTVDNAFTLTPPPPPSDQHRPCPYASPRDQVLFTLAAIEDALPGSSPSPPAPRPFASFSSHHSSSSLFYSLDRHERDSFLSTFRAEAVVGGGSFLGQSDTQIRNSVATSIMATVHTDDVRVLCAGLDKVCKDQMATWQIRWSFQGPNSVVSRHCEALRSTKQGYGDINDDDSKLKPMGRLFEYQGEWFEEWQDPTALVPTSPDEYGHDVVVDEDGHSMMMDEDDEAQYRWTEMTGVAGSGSLLTLVVRPMTDEELYDEVEETGSVAHMTIESVRSGGSISSSVSHYGHQHEEQAYRYQKKQQRRRERMAREEGLSWIHNQSSGPMRPLTDSAATATAAALALTPSEQESRQRRRRQSISGGSSSSISSMCSTSSLSMVPYSSSWDHGFYRRRSHRRESDYSEDGYSSSEEHVRYSYYVVDPVARQEIPRGPHMPDSFAHPQQQQQQHPRRDSIAMGRQQRRMSSCSGSVAWNNEASWPASRAMSTCSSVVIRHTPPSAPSNPHQHQHQYLLTTGGGNNNSSNSNSGWQVTSIPSVMSLPSKTLPPWNVLTTIALEAWQMWIQTIHAGQAQFQDWCEYVVELAIDQTIDNFMMAFRVVGWITGSSALLVVTSSSKVAYSSAAKSVMQGKGQSQSQQQQQQQQQREPLLRHKGSRSSLPSFSVSRRNSQSSSSPGSVMWPPHKTQTRIKSTPAWLRRHQQQQRRRRRQQGGGDATILEEMEEEVEDEDDDEEEEEYENGVEPSIIKNDVSVTGTTSTQTVVSTTENSVQQRPQRPGLHRRYWSTNNAPQLSSLKAHELESSAYPSPPPPMVKPSGMERAGKLLDEVPVVGRLTRYVGCSWVGKKIKGRLELQQDRIDGVLDQVVDWVEVAAATLPIPATITARIGMSKVGTS